MSDDAAQSARQVLWPASLQLGFRQQGERTVLLREGQLGPLRVLKPFYPEAQVCHVTVLHPPGGIAGGDELRLGLRLEVDTAALVTTPAANKFYRCDGLSAFQHQHFSVADDAVLEWLPQETLLFGGSRVESQTSVQLAPRAAFIGMDLFALGRPASGDRYRDAHFSNRVSIRRADKTLLHEHLRLAPGSALIEAPWGLGGASVFGSLYATALDNSVVPTLREALSGFAAGRWAVTLVDELLLVRYRGMHTEEGLALLRQAWRTCRPLLAGRAACAPRIWNT